MLQIDGGHPALRRLLIREERGIKISMLLPWWRKQANPKLHLNVDV